MMQAYAPGQGERYSIQSSLEAQMHALLVTFESSADPADLQQPFTEYADALTQREGLVMKTWICQGEVLGGFHLFVDRDAADRYLVEMLEPLVADTPAFTNFQAHHFDVLEDWSAKNGTPVRASVNG
jgi:hypothetical protein